MSVVAELGGDGDREVLERDLRHPVHHEPRDVVQRRRGRHVQDPSAASGSHHRRYRPHRQQRCPQIHGEHQVEALQVDVEVAGEGDRGVVHQHVDPTERLDGVLHHRCDVVVAGEVRRDRDGLATGRGDLPHGVVDRAGEAQRRVVGRSRRAGHPGAARRERGRGGGADPAAGARDDRGLPGEVHADAEARRPTAAASDGQGRSGRVWCPSRFAAYRSPSRSTRASTSAVSKRNAVGSSRSATPATSSQDTGVETVGRGCARRE